MFLLEKSILMSDSEKNLGCTEGGGMEPAGLTALQLLRNPWLHNAPARLWPEQPAAVPVSSLRHLVHLNSLGQYKVFAQECQLIMLTQQENLTSL